MNPPPAPANQESAGWCRLRHILLWILAAPIIGLGLLIVLSLLVGSGRLEVLWVLVTGWIAFLSRTLPRVALNWDLLGMAGLCTAVLLWGGHRTLTGLGNRIAAVRGSGRRWRWRWTVSGLVGMALLFLVGMAVGGAAHQIGWLGSQSGSWFEVKNNKYFQLRIVEMSLMTILADDDCSLSRVRSDLADLQPRNQPGRNSNPPALDQIHVLLIVDSANKVEGALLFHREVAKRGQRGAIYHFRDESENGVSPARLSELIQKHQGQLVAL